VLELAFESKLLRTVCENETCATRKLGPTVAEALKHRLRICALLHLSRTSW
jgi:hypothetical protein